MYADHPTLENVAIYLFSKKDTKYEQNLYLILSEENFALLTLKFIGRALVKHKVKNCLSSKKYPYFM